MFRGKTFIHEGGHKGWAVRFAEPGKGRGVATTAYSFSMTDEERFEMARRITAALNLLSNCTTEQIEEACRRNLADKYTGTKS